MRTSSAFSSSARSKPPLPVEPPRLRLQARTALRQSDQALEADCDVIVLGSQAGDKASGVKIVHRVTGIAATASQRRSELQNRIMAFVLLRERLYALARFPKPRRHATLGWR